TSPSRIWARLRPGKTSHRGRASAPSIAPIRPAAARTGTRRTRRRATVPRRRPAAICVCGKPLVDTVQRHRVAKVALLRERIVSGQVGKPVGELADQPEGLTRRLTHSLAEIG